MTTPITDEQLEAIKARATQIDTELISHAVWTVVGEDTPALLAEVERLKAERDQVLRLVADWCTEANDIGGVDAGDLAWRLEAAGFPLHELPSENEPSTEAAR